MKAIYILLIAFIMAILVFSTLYLINLRNYGTDISVQNSTSKSIKNNTSLETNFSNNTVQLDILNNSALLLPSNDTILSRINWSKYELIDNPRVTGSEIAKPNQIINHSFISVSVNVDIKDSNNVVGIYTELSGIAIELRNLLGPNSAPDVWGIYNGGDYFNAIICPYEGIVYRYDYYHPVNNLTWNHIAISELRLPD